MFVVSFCVPLNMFFAHTKKGKAESDTPHSDADGLPTAGSPRGTGVVPVSSAIDSFVRWYLVKHEQKRRGEMKHTVNDVKMPTSKADN